VGLLAWPTGATSNPSTSTALDASSPEAGVKSSASVPNSMQGGAETAASSIVDISTVG
jgi:hypothetical protein